MSRRPASTCPRQTASTVTIPAGGTYKAVWPVAVTSGAGEVKVLMSAQTVAAIPPLEDAVEITLPVYRYTTPEVVGTSGQVGPDEQRLELVRVPANADPTQGELDVTLEPSLAAGTLGGLTYLEHYPYECTEQTMSRFLPNVVTYAALKELGVHAARSGCQAPAAGGRGVAADLRAAARGRRLGLVAERRQPGRGLVVRRLRPGEGQAGRLHRGSDRAGSRRALPDAKASRRRRVSNPGSSTGRRSPSTRWPRPGRWSRTGPARCTRRAKG